MPDNSFLRMEMKGWRELAKSLQELGDDKEIRKVMKKALMKVAQPAADYAKSLAAKRTGKYANKIGVGSQVTRRQRRASDRPGPDEAFVYFGPRGSSPGHLIEFGTGPRRQANGKSTGAMPPQPHMRPAFESFKHQMIEQLGKALGDQIEKSAARIAKRQAKLIRESQR